MTSLPLVLDDDEPIGIILRAGRKMLRPAKIWAYCWFTDEAEGGAGNHTHRHLPERSEEHTSELQSHSDLVCRLLLEKKKKKNMTNNNTRRRQTTDSNT